MSIVHARLGTYQYVMYELSDFICRSHVIFIAPKIGRATLRLARERAREVPVRSCKDHLRNLTVQLFPFVCSSVSIPGVISCAESSHEMRPDYSGISQLSHIGEPHFYLQLLKHATRVPA